MLTMTSSIENKILIIDVQGVLDSQTSNDFKAWIEEQFIEGFRLFALDLANTRYLSSKGIGSLIQVNQIISQKLGKIVLFHVRNEIKRLMEFLKIDSKVYIVDSKKEAIQKLLSLGDASGASNNTSLKEDVDDYMLEDLEKKPISTRQYTEEFEIPTNIFEETTEKSIQKSDSEICIEDEKQGDFVDNKHHTNSDSQKKNLEPEEVHNSSANSAVTIADLGHEYNKQKVYCPHCGTNLRVGKPGKYICPTCEGKFTYPF